MKSRFWCYLLACALVLSSLALSAQDADDDVSPDDDAESIASLVLNFDREGAVRIDLGLPAPASDEMPDVVARSFHCPLGGIHHPDGFELDSSPATKSSQTAKYQKQIAEFNQRQLTGHCDAAMARQDGVLQTDFDYAPLLTELQRAGVDQLVVSVEIPKTQYQDYGTANGIRTLARTNTTLTYSVAVGDESAPKVLHLAYGFRREDLYRALAILAAFLVAPILITLWMRRGALASAKSDPAAAWFGFVRSLNWLVTGAMLLWMTSGFGARQALEDWVATQGLAVWKAVAADLMIVTGPAWVIYFACIALSYPIHAQLRGKQWTRGEFLLRQFVVFGARIIPLLLVVGGLDLMSEQPEFAVALLAVALVMLQALYLLRVRVIKEFPQPLMTGELRDRIFALAKKLGVAVSQIYVVPAGKGQVANAYAANNRIVMFTDYLLEHLSKREVDAVAAHELSHLRHKHPIKLGLAMGAAIFLPRYFDWLFREIMGLVGAGLGLMPASVSAGGLLGSTYRAFHVFELWSQRDFVLIVFGLTGFYFLSRRFENQADATAVRLTNDPEAQITGLLKLSRLNFVPIQWGKFSESWLTHPSMVRRAERIAAAGGMEPGRLQEILAQYSDSAIQRDVALPSVPPEERYQVPAVSDPERMKQALRERSRVQAKMWGMLLAYVLPLALFSALLERLQLSGSVTLWLELAGAAIAAPLVTLAGVWLGESGRKQEKQRILQRFERERMPVGREGDILVGFAPGPYPRIFGARYHWDSGFLQLAKDRLLFVGEQTRFSMRASEIDGIVVGRGGPSWWKFERIYVRWKADDGRNGIFNLYPLDPGSVWKTGERARDLYRWLEDWRRGSGQFPEVRPELADVGTLSLGQVTSVSPAHYGNLAAIFRVCFMLLLIAGAAGTLLHADLLYLCLSVVAIRLYETIPFWRYRDRLPAFPESSGAGSSKARVASAAGQP